MNKIYTALTAILFLCAAAQSASAQKINGYVYDASNNDAPLAGVTVYYTDKTGQHGEITNSQGWYEISVPEGGTMLTYSFLGYEVQNVPLVMQREEVLRKDIFLHEAANELDAVVVSAGRFAQKLSDVTVSMNVIKTDDIVKQNPSDLRSTLTTISGVEIVDKQPSIRGGSGWTYGVGSRCMIMVDGMSILTPNGGEINWNAVPMENIEQVEVMKGASSVLYGSSALNGLINIRTSRPGLKPVTRVDAYMGIYGNPDNTDYIWYDRTFWKDGKYDVEPLMRRSVLYGVRNPMYNGLNMSHSRRIGDWDVSGYMNLFADEGFKKGGYNKRMRVGGAVDYHDPAVNGLTYGASIDFMSSDAADALLWRSAKSPYEQSPVANMARENNEFYIAPHITYSNSKNDTEHRLKAKLYWSSNNIKERPVDKTLIDILNNMGFDYDRHVPDLINNGGSILGGMLPTLLEGDWGKIVNLLERTGDHFFPNADTGDYMDLISWIMHKGLPGQGNMLNWALNQSFQKPEPFKFPDRTAQYYLDYQFNKRFNHGGQITTGLTYDHVYANSEVTSKHYSDNISLYAQYDDTFFGKLNFSLGARLEYYRVDEHYKEAETKIFGKDIPVKPVFRAGLNYRVAEATFVRASIGQGFRYPSMTEKYLYKDIGGVKGYPNSNLKPEKGTNIEVGIKQGYMFGPVKGMLDVAGFFTQYRNMIEFNIGLFDDTDFSYLNNTSEILNTLVSGHGMGLGAQFSNVEKARIYGLDISTTGIVNINHRLNLTYNIGYVYTEPRDQNYRKQNEIEDAYTDPLQMKQKSNSSKYLKYRQKHSVKAVLDLNWKRLSVGTNLQWKSKTLAADYFMVDERPRESDVPRLMDVVRYIMFGDLHGYWEEHNKSYFVMDVRASVKVTDNVRFQFSVNNVLNKEYSIRPMDLGAPRTFIFQCGLTF